MKKIVLFIMFFMMTSVAYAEPAVIITGEGCGMIDGNGGFVFTTDTRKLITNSNNDNLKLTCKSEVTPSVDGSAVKYDENLGSCIIFTDAGVFEATNWQETISSANMKNPEAMAQATLTCHYNGQQAD